LIEDSLYGLTGTLSSNSVEVLVHRLRKKLASAGASVGIHTIHGVGYILMAEDS
jgi:DNA-binding response OmpR family regulator